MIRAGVTALLLLASAGGGDDAQERPRPMQGGVLTVRGQIIIRVSPGASGPAPIDGQFVRWHEDRGPRCIPANRIFGAEHVGQESVDIVFRDNSRVRARLERRCPALDFYYGFYIRPTADGMICADRDSIRSRVGGECQIDRFRTLRAVRP